MEEKAEIDNRISHKKTFFKYKTQDTCPICKAKIEPIFIAGCFSENRKVYIFNYCRSCKGTFIDTYTTIGTDIEAAREINLIENKCVSSEPNHFVERDFDKRIRDISPQFCKIYNQALEAETKGLDEIAGMGYRKAIEFLVKDYAINENSAEKDKIKSEFLGECIDNYMPDKIKTLLKKSTWIGNDETHYTKKYENYDISDMKKFIDAAVNFIDMILVIEEADQMR